MQHILKPEMPILSPHVPLGQICTTNKIQRRARGEVYQHIKQLEPLRKGFGGFYSEPTISDKVGDTARKHFDEVSGAEAPWRSSVHAVLMNEQERSKRQGRRVGHPLPSGAGVELHDIPRGMRHVLSPRSGDIPLFDKLIGPGAPIRRDACDDMRGVLTPEITPRGSVLPPLTGRGVLARPY